MPDTAPAPQRVDFTPVVVGGLLELVRRLNADNPAEDAMKAVDLVGEPLCSDD